MTELRQSPLHAEHEKLGASFTAFGPWNMPLKYGNELEEHRAVRTACGLFDLSHMGEIRVTGPDAGAFLENEFLAVPNAGNAETVFQAFVDRAAKFDVELVNESTDTALIAVQGPNAEALLVTLTNEADGQIVKEMKYYSAAPVTVAGHEVLLARTGYTGEDGFELFLPNAGAADLWERILQAGDEFGLRRNCCPAPRQPGSWWG